MPSPALASGPVEESFTRMLHTESSKDNVRLMFACKLLGRGSQHRLSIPVGQLPTLSPECHLEPIAMARLRMSNLELCPMLVRPLVQGAPFKVV